MIEKTKLSSNFEILISDIKKTLGFPRKDENYWNFEILISDIKKTLGFPQKKV